MSKLFKIAKKYYEKGLWDDQRLQLLVENGSLTQEEYNQIVSA